MMASGRLRPESTRNSRQLSKHSGVRSVIADDGEQFIEVLAEDSAGEEFLACLHPVGIAAHGVDFTVVGHVTERLGTGPAGEGVGTEA